MDLIDRQAAIDALLEEVRLVDGYYVENDEVIDKDDAVEAMRLLPSAQPEIIRCKDCKYNDYNRRRMSVRWLPCMDVRTGSNWFCGSAERLEE